MNLRRVWIMFIARNKEFYRDKAAFGWNLFFPFLIILGFGIIFSGGNKSIYKVGLFPAIGARVDIKKLNIHNAFKNIKYIEFIGLKDKEQGMLLLKRHRIDLLLKANEKVIQYWVSKTSPKGYIVEQVIKANLSGNAVDSVIKKETIEGREIKYIDWLFPGIMSMNMMFSALWGVGYIIVRYRKNKVLRRLKGTPITPLEYLASQLASRVAVIMVSLIIVWIGCDLIFDFHMEGSYLDSMILFFLGAVSLCSMGLLVASRGISEDFTSGLLNFITWPMMFLSEVWFSLEGAPEWVRTIGKVFPLMHVNNGVRKIMNEGATLSQVTPEILFLVIFSVLSLVLASRLFSWN